MSAIDANARVLGDIRLSLVTAAEAEVRLSKVSVRVMRAHSEKFRLSKITITCLRAANNGLRKNKRCNSSDV